MSQTVQTLALMAALLIAAPAVANEKPAEPAPSKIAAAPAEKPVEKTAEKPAEKPVEKPAMTAPKADLALAAAGTYQLDPAHTNVFFRVAHLGFSGYMGRFNKIEGKVVLDPKDLGKTTLDVTIDAASLDINNEKLAAELRDKDAFDVATHPSISFKATKLEQKDASHGTITGDLTLRGVTKPITLDVALNGVGNHPMTQKATLGFSATGMLKRSDFGLVKWLPMVGEQVQIIIETEMQLGG
jgi:polyisoprenoid-binding protein YceI